MCEEHGKESLETRRLSFLFSTITTINLMEQTFPHLSCCFQLLGKGTFLRTASEFAIGFATHKPEVNLTIIVGEITLCGMTDKTSQRTEQETPDAPLYTDERHGLMPQTDDDAHIDKHKPHIAGQTVEYASYQSLLLRETRQLSVGRVTEIRHHQQENATDIMPQVGIMKQPSATGAQEDAQHRNHIRSGPYTCCHERQCQPYWTRKIHIQPLLSIIRFKRIGQQFSIALLHQSMQIVRKGKQKKGNTIYLFAFLTQYFAVRPIYVTFAS